MKPKRILCRPKKSNDQRRLNISWIVKMLKRRFFLSPKFFSQTKNSEIPIIIKRIVHTGANNQFGGLKDGLFIVLYHVLTDLEVNTEPKKPITKGIIIETISRKNFCKFTSL